MKNQICLPKKIVYIFYLFFLITGIVSLVIFINKTFVFNQKTLATYSCPAPNQEVTRTDKEMCFEVCQSYGGYLSQDFNALKCCCKGNGTTPTVTPNLNTPFTSISSPTFTPTPTTKVIKMQNDSCIFNPLKICPFGEIKIVYNGFCACTSSTANSTIKNRRCMDETSPLYDTPNHYLAWVEEYKNNKWQMVKTCLYPNPVCHPITFQCVNKGITGTKKFGEKCQAGSECQSGECNSQYISPSGEHVIIPDKQCTYSLIEQGQYAKKRRNRDLKLAVEAAALLVATVSLPIIAPTYLIAQTYGISAATIYLLNQLQQPWIQNTMARINVAFALYSLSDCLENGSNGEWCNMLAMIASGNPGEFGMAFAQDFNTLMKNARSLALGDSLVLAKTMEEATAITDISELNTLPADETAATVIPYQPANPPKTSKYPWLQGQRLPTNRGDATVMVDTINGSGSFGYIYRATLEEPGMPPKLIVIKIPKNLTAAEIQYLIDEQILLGNAYNKLPTNLKNNLAKPYGFATVETSIGKIEAPMIEKFSEGNTLGNIINSQTLPRIDLSQSQVDELFKTAQVLDNNKIYLRDIMPNNIWLTDDGRLILYDPFMPRLNPDTGSIVVSTSRTYSNEDVFRYRLNQNLLKQVGSKWKYFVPISNVEALERMFKLYNEVINIVK